MKKKLLFLLIFSQLIKPVFAQVHILPLNKQAKGHWLSYSFPLVQSSINKKAAGKINDYLQSEILYNDKTITDTNKVFEKSRYISGDSVNQSGYSEIKYQTAINTPSVLSLIFNMEATGAYSSNYNKYYNFNNRTGELLLAKDLFSPAGIEEMKKKLIATRKLMIGKIVAELDSLYNPLQDSAIINETYTECNQDASENNFLLKEKSIVFYKDYCFPHWGLLYDSDLAVEFTYKELYWYLSESGRKLILSKK